MNATRIATAWFLVLIASSPAASGRVLATEAAVAAFSGRLEATAAIGSPCDTPAGEVCNNGLDDDGDALNDCLDTDCAPAEGDVVCGPDGLTVPACQPLLDDPAKIKFRMPRRLDFIFVAGSAVPLSPMDPAAENFAFLLMNASGVVYQQAIPANSFISNTKQTVWKYVLRKTGSPMIFNARIIKKYNKMTAETYYLLKVKAEADAGKADPLRNSDYTEAELANMFVQISVGDDSFYNSATWERKTWGWYLADRYMF